MALIDALLRQLDESRDQRRARLTEEAVHDGDRLDAPVQGTPRCPHCGAEETDWWEMNFQSDGDTREVSCGSCEEEYTIEISISPEFRTWRKP